MDSQDKRREETDLAFSALRKRLEIMEMMTSTMKWVAQVADENEKLRSSLADSDLTRIEMMLVEEQREQYMKQAESLRTRLDMWQESALGLAEILLSLEKKGMKLTKTQQKKLAKVMQESYRNDG